MAVFGIIYPDFTSTQYPSSNEFSKFIPPSSFTEVRPIDPLYVNNYEDGVGSSNDVLAQYYELMSLREEERLPILTKMTNNSQYHSAIKTLIVMLLDHEWTPNVHKELIITGGVALVFPSNTLTKLSQLDFENLNYLQIYDLSVWLYFNLSSQPFKSFLNLQISVLNALLQHLFQNELANLSIVLVHDQANDSISSDYLKLRDRIIQLISPVLNMDVNSLTKKLSDKPSLIFQFIESYELRLKSDLERLIKVEEDVTPFFTFSTMQELIFELSKREDQNGIALHKLLVDQEIISKDVHSLNQIFLKFDPKLDVNILINELNAHTLVSSSVDQLRLNYYKWIINPLMDNSKMDKDAYLIDKAKFKDDLEDKIQRLEKGDQASQDQISQLLLEKSELLEKLENSTESEPESLCDRDLYVRPNEKGELETENILKIFRDEDIYKNTIGSVSSGKISNGPLTTIISSSNDQYLSLLSSLTPKIGLTISFSSSLDYDVPIIKNGVITITSAIQLYGLLWDVYFCSKYLPIIHLQVDAMTDELKMFLPFCPGVFLIDYDIEIDSVVSVLVAPLASSPLELTDLYIKGDVNEYFLFSFSGDILPTVLTLPFKFGRPSIPMKYLNQFDAKLFSFDQSPFFDFTHLKFDLMKKENCTTFSHVNLPDWILNNKNYKDDVPTIFSTGSGDDCFYYFPDDHAEAAGYTLATRVAFISTDDRAVSRRLLEGYLCGCQAMKITGHANIIDRTILLHFFHHESRTRLSTTGELWAGLGGNYDVLPIISRSSEPKIEPSTFDLIVYLDDIEKLISDVIMWRSEHGLSLNPYPYIDEARTVIKSDFDVSLPYLYSWSLDPSGFDIDLRFIKAVLSKHRSHEVEIISHLYKLIWLIMVPTILDEINRMNSFELKFINDQGVSQIKLSDVLNDPEFYFISSGDLTPVIPEQASYKFETNQENVIKLVSTSEIIKSLGSEDVFSAAYQRLSGIFNLMNGMKSNYDDRLYDIYSKLVISENLSYKAFLVEYIEPFNQIDVLKRFGKAESVYEFVTNLIQYQLFNLKPEYESSSLKPLHSYYFNRFYNNAIFERLVETGVGMYRDGMRQFKALTLEIKRDNPIFSTTQIPSRLLTLLNRNDPNFDGRHPRDVCGKLESELMEKFQILLSASRAEIFMNVIINRIHAIVAKKSMVSADNFYMKKIATFTIIRDNAICSILNENDLSVKAEGSLPSKTYSFDKIFLTPHDLISDVIGCYAMNDDKPTTIIFYGYSGAGKSTLIEGYTSFTGLYHRMLKMLPSGTAISFLEYKSKPLKMYDLITSKEASLGSATQVALKNASDKFKKALKNRTTGHNGINARSSRSHMQIRFIIPSSGGFQYVNVLDLAGNEKPDDITGSQKAKFMASLGTLPSGQTVDSLMLNIRQTGIMINTTLEEIRKMIMQNARPSLVLNHLKVDIEDGHVLLFGVTHGIQSKKRECINAFRFVTQVLMT